MDTSVVAVSVIAMVREFKPEDEGMTVRAENGDRVGTIEKVEGDTAHVKPKSGLPQRIRTRLGWDDEQGSAYKMSRSQVKEFSGDEVHLKD